MSSEPQMTAEQQEQMRQYVEQLRQADPAEIIAQAFTMLGTGAEVKLGRPDARTLIDAIGGIVSGVEGRVPEQLLEGMRNGHAQLQQAQVMAEQEAQGGSTEAPTGEPSAEEAAGPESQGAPSAADQQMTNRLWIPGRDQ